MAAPTTGEDFDRAYRAPITFWGDIRIPEEVKALARRPGVRSSLELGCGIGRFSRWVARSGVRATAVDFSQVAIARAKERVAHDHVKPEYLVGDVTDLGALGGPFDLSFDVGCFHCLDAPGQQAYAKEVFRLLAPGGTHLIWALDESPSDLTLSPAAVERVFAPRFVLAEARASRRRIVRSHWYWLTRAIVDA